jgi:hypothetical protein
MKANLPQGLAIAKFMERKTEFGPSNLVNVHDSLSLSFFSRRIR